ncbi:zinc finger CW-type PWWP domain protein 1 isoform X1 [Erinaceus europaeus]|uniref:Zinc finger CW-type PWWP domain protein 1 isoform X1 n=1 Tax=Erinaceus europaeus TaxID=9365 RepID=A0ABM3VYH4_ERIEU|nr:zinc finger CW-type PWWP domain protein 1 isoform X1 [Erinaceus europaeus]XP_060029380.1 zinc finger CW-type PWWP domain protein 1 isoform X1 [Erinaceus europaeus]
MAASQNKEECEKGLKKIFAPPAQKLLGLVACSSNSSQEEVPRISSPEAEPRPNLTKAQLEKKEKAAAETGLGSGRGKKGKTQNPKKTEKKGKEKSSITNEEFEEIVQIVLQKSFQNCLDTTYAQSMGCSKLHKEPEIVSSATGNNSADGERVMITHILEISASQEDRLPEIKTSVTDQPAPVPAVKKISKLSSNKRKKETQNENVEKTQSGPEHRQKDQPKKTAQDPSQSRNHQEEEESGFGQCQVWVQCSSPNCEKWRRLQGNIDPSVLPDNWSCEQNTDLAYNRCDIPEETWTGHESDVAYASYIPGSIVWAKQHGYPWWPGMVESDPDLGEYFLFASHLDSLPSKYHVTFFGETVSRAWIPVNMMKNFQELSLELSGVKKCRNKDYIQKLKVALMMAQKAEQINIQARVGVFGFWSRYSGSDNTGERKGVNSPNSSSEKEEEESELEEEVEDEEKKKKSLALLSSKAAKIQTKKSKSRGEADKNPTDGQKGTLQKKTVKRPLGNELVAPPVAISKEGQTDSNPDQPGPKKKFKPPPVKPSEINLSEEKEASVVPKGLFPSAHCETRPTVGKQGPEPQELPPQEAGSAPLDNEIPNDLDLDQLMEEIVKEPEKREELQQRDGAEELTRDFSEE